MEDSNKKFIENVYPKNGYSIFYVKFTKFSEPKINFKKPLKFKKLELYRSIQINNYKIDPQKVDILILNTISKIQRQKKN